MMRLFASKNPMIIVNETQVKKMVQKAGPKKRDPWTHFQNACRGASSSFEACRLFCRVLSVKHWQSSPGIRPFVLMNPAMNGDDLKKRGSCIIPDLSRIQGPLPGISFEAVK